MSSDTYIVVGRAWIGDVLYQEQTWNIVNAPFTMGPFDTDWVFEIERMGHTDRVNVVAGNACTWEPILP